MLRSMLRPGQGFRYFEAYNREGGLSENGRPATKEFVYCGRFAGIIMRASHGEVEQWKSREQFRQEGHPITHKIIQRGSQLAIKASDMLESTQDGKTRRFIVKGITEPGELGYFTVYFVEEREDLQ